VQGTGVDPTFRTAYMHPEKRYEAWFGLFQLKEVRGYFRKVSRFVRRVDVEGVAWEVIGNTISLSSRRSHIFTGDLYFHKTTTGWLQSIISKFSGFVSVIDQSLRALRVIQQPPVLI